MHVLRNPMLTAGQRTALASLAGIRMEILRVA